MISTFHYRLSDPSKSGHVSEVGICVNNTPIDLIYVGDKLIASNSDIENGGVEYYNSLTYSSDDWKKPTPYYTSNSYTFNTKINDAYTSLPDSDIEHEIYDVRIHMDSATSPIIYPFSKEKFDWGYGYEDTDTPIIATGPLASERPQPIFIKTAYFDNGVLQELGSIIRFFYNADFTNEAYNCNVTGYITEVNNLKPKTNYYYKVYKVVGSLEVEITLLTDHIRTIGQVRMINFEHVRNVRDLGGWITLDGKSRFKYGLVYRGGRPGLIWWYTNPSPASGHRFEAELNRLNITKSLNVGDYSSDLEAYDTNPASGTIAQYTPSVIKNETNISDSVSYGGIYNNFTSFLKFVNQIVTLVLQNKGTYFHCYEGRDRTGTYAAILECICDINTDGILKDYELTTFWGHDTTRATLWYYATKDGKTEDTRLWLKFTLNYNDTNYPTIQSKVQLWFKDNYNALTANTNRVKYINHDNETVYITDADYVLEYIRGILLESNIDSDKTVAVLGDSLSAYRIGRHGYSPSNLWWYLVAEHIGANPSINLNNNSIGNTKVTEKYGNDEQNRGFSYERINNLKVNGKDPDIIFVMMGGNDWAGSVAIGDYPGKSQLLNEDYGTILDRTTSPEFKPAFALLLYRLKETYQNAKVVCINLPLLKYDKNGNNKYFVDYMSAIIDVTNLFKQDFGVSNFYTVDLFTLCGNTIYNSAQSSSSNQFEYLSDGEVHLNPKGLAYIANIINQQLNNMPI